MKDIIPISIAVLVMLSWFGWYSAEADNEILRKELSHYTGKEVRK